MRTSSSLAKQAGKLGDVPHIPMLQERNVRTGFFEREQFESVQAHLPEPLRGLVAFAYITGLARAQRSATAAVASVDFAAGRVRLEPGQTKNGEGRLFPMTTELRTILQEQRDYTDAVQRVKGALVPFVFHRNGKSITAFAKTWKSACAAAGCPGGSRTTSDAPPCRTWCGQACRSASRCR